jgi:hypothetical protein
MSSIVLPLCGKSERFKTKRPKWMLTHPDGRLMVEHALDGWEGEVYAGVLYEHDQEFDASNVLKRAFGERAKVVVIERSDSHSESVMKIIMAFELEEESIIVRDCDNKVGVVLPETECDFIAVEKRRGPQDDNKGYLDDEWFSVGVYGFKSAKRFIDEYEPGKQLLDYLRDSLRIFVERYKDWGTQEDWDEELENHKTYFIDLDGVVFRNASKYFKPYWEEAEAIAENVAWIDSLPKEASLCFITARSKDYAKPTFEQLRAAFPNRKWHLIMGLPHSQRVIINDNSPNALYQSCVAINTRRDGLIEDACGSEV